MQNRKRVANSQPRNCRSSFASRGFLVVPRGNPKSLWPIVEAVGHNLAELRKKRDAAKQKVRAAYALSSRSLDEWRKQLAIVDDAEKVLVQTELEIAEELCLRHAWKFPALDHKPGSLEAAIDDFLWELRKSEK